MENFNKKIVLEDGEDRKADFINIVTFGKQTEFVGKYFKKGQQILACGRLEINQYEDENGEKKYSTQVIAEELNFADSKKDNSENNYDFLYANTDLTESTSADSSNNDDLPF